MTTPIDVPASQTWNKAAAEAWYNTTAFKNTLFTTNNELGVVDPFNLTAPKFTLASSSPLKTGSYWNIPTGISTPKVVSANSLTIYPNPANSEVVVELPEFRGVTAIEVRDLTGKLVVSKSSSSIDREILNISELNKGIYLMVVRQGNSTYSQKLSVR
jgi:hypothetical protein